MAKHKVTFHKSNDINLPAEGEESEVFAIVGSELEERKTLKEFNKVFNIDPAGGSVVVAEALKMFGNIKGERMRNPMTGEPILPKTLTVGTQKNIYSSALGNVTEEALWDADISTVAHIATEAGVKIPSPYGEHDRKSIIESALATAFLRPSKELDYNPNWLRIVGKIRGEEQVPFGLLSVLTPSGKDFGLVNIMSTDPEGKPFKGKLKVVVTTKTSNAHVVEEFFRRINDNLNESIFDNAIVNFNKVATSEGETTDYFVDPDPDLVHRLVYSDEQESLIKNLIFNRIAFRDKIKRVQPNLAKATVLQPGIYGTGKTSTQMIVAWFAITQGWTCVQYMPSRGATADEFREMLEFAKQHSPALLMVEDIETIIDPSDQKAFKNLLDDLDGPASKGFDNITMMTTNHEGQIHGSIIRRLQAVIPFEGLDRNGVERMVKKAAGKHWVGYEGPESLRSTIYDIATDAQVSQDQGLDRIVDMLTEIAVKVQDEHGKTLKHGVPHWLVSLVIERALCFALPQPGDDMYISQVEMVASAKTLVPQFAMYTANAEDHDFDGEMYMAKVFVKELVAELENKDRLITK